MRVVLDTNVIVSGAIIRDSKPAQILDLWQEGKFQLILSPKILDEIKGVLHCPKIKKAYHLPERDLQNLLDALSEKALLVFPRKKVNICRDPHDNKFLEASSEAGADYLITGDKDLLNLKKFKTTKILSPDEFLKLK